MSDKLNRVVAIIKSWIKKKETGNIQVNMFKGGIANVNLNKSIKLDDDEK